MKIIIFGRNLLVPGLTIVLFLIAFSAKGDAVSGSVRIPISPALSAALATGEELERDAARDLHAGDYVAAEEQALAAINAYKWADKGYDIVGQALECQKKYSDALAAYSKDVDFINGSYIGSPEPLLRYSNMALEQGHWREALLAYAGSFHAKPTESGDVKTISGQVFNLNSPDPDQLSVAIHIDRAELNCEYNDIAGEPLDKEAIEHYSAALAIDPTSPRANYGLGLVLKSLGRLDEAKAAFRKGLEAADGDMKAKITLQMSAL